MKYLKQSNEWISLHLYASLNGNNSARHLLSKRKTGGFFMENAALFIGIDISKDKHDVAIMNRDKQLVGSSFVIGDNSEGYQQLISKITHYSRKNKVEVVYIGMEATGDYWKNLYHFLNSQIGDFIISVINPVRTRAFAKTELRRAKTDPVNAKDIAQFMVEKRPAAYQKRAPLLNLIKDLTQQNSALKKQEAMSINRLRCELTKVAPEIERHFTNLGRVQILALLSQFPTAEMIGKSEIKGIRYGRKQWLLPQSFILKVKALCGQSVAYASGPGSGYVVQSLVRHIQNIQGERKIIEQQLLELYQQISPTDSILCTIPGIGVETAILIEACIGDINRFSNVKQFVAYFGMNPTINQSGKFIRRSSYLEKKGSGLVRQKLFMAVLNIISRKKGLIYEFYARKVKEGKPKLVAICAAMRKLLVIIYSMLKKKTPFDPNFKLNKQ